MSHNVTKWFNRKKQMLECQWHKKIAAIVMNTESQSPHLTECDKYFFFSKFWIAFQLTECNLVTSSYINAWLWRNSALLDPEYCWSGYVSICLSFLQPWLARHYADFWISSLNRDHLAHCMSQLMLRKPPLHKLCARSSIKWCYKVTLSSSHLHRCWQLIMYDIRYLTSSYHVKMFIFQKKMAIFFTFKIVTSLLLLLLFFLLLLESNWMSCIWWSCSENAQAN